MVGVVTSMWNSLSSGSANRAGSGSESGSPCFLDCLVGDRFLYFL